jgi:hypothetical protein
VTLRGVPLVVRSALTRRARGARSEQGRDLAEALVAGGPLPNDLPAAYASVATVLDALSAPPTSSELRGEQQAMAAFRVAMSADLTTTSPRSASPRRRRAFALGSLTGVNLLVAGVAAAVPVGGLAAAAYTDSLPRALQSFAHRTVGAPAPHVTPSSAATHAHSPRGYGQSSAPASTPGSPAGSASPKAPVGPDASAAAAHGLCTAWSHGGLSPHSTAYTSLAHAAGTPAGITTYCAGVLAPAPSATPTPRTTHPTHPAHPSHPVKPTSAATPSHPAHPSHPAKKPTPSRRAHPSHPVAPTKPATPTSSVAHQAKPGQTTS